MTVDTTYASYLESLRRMHELANARGFYPVYAVIPDSSAGGASHFAPWYSSKGGGKSKGFVKGR